jgi:Fe-S cluster assembly scaffold protein SufB
MAEKKKLDSIQLNLLRQVADLHEVPEGAYSLRIDGELYGKNSSQNIVIEKKTDKPGIDIYIKAGTKNESVHIPVILAQSGLRELVYNDFHIGEDADVVIIAGCGIHNCGVQDSEHSGEHSFYVGKNAKLKYVEKHYGDGDGNGKNVMNPHTVVVLEEGAYMEMETTQIKGVDSTRRKTDAILKDRSTLVVHEKIMTHGEQFAETEFNVDLQGEDCGTHVVSRSVAKDNSKQLFISDVIGNNRCSGHTECDAIIMDNASVQAIPKIVANNTEASLIHEAAIGKIAGEQLIKLMTLGLDEKQAEEEIINGFLK